MGLFTPSARRGQVAQLRARTAELERKLSDAHASLERELAAPTVHLRFTNAAHFMEWLASVSVYRGWDLCDITDVLRDYRGPLVLRNEFGRVLWDLDYDDDGIFTAIPHPRPW